MSQRAFVVRVDEHTPRILVEDVRTRELAVVTDLEGIGPRIAQWLGEEAAPPAPVPQEEAP